MAVVFIIDHSQLQISLFFLHTHCCTWLVFSCWRSTFVRNSLIFARRQSLLLTSNFLKKMRIKSSVCILILIPHGTASTCNLLDFCHCSQHRQCASKAFVQQELKVLLLGAEEEKVSYLRFCFNYMVFISNKQHTFHRLMKYSKG